MRITNSMLIGTVLRDLNSNMGKISNLEEQMASGRRINKPSDDPVGLITSLRLRTGLQELEKYKSNAQDAGSWLNETDSALSESGDILQRVRELTVQADNSYLSPLDREAIAKEISQLKEQLIQVSNVTYAGRYIFSGTETQAPAFDSSGSYQGNTSAINYEVGLGVQIPINVDGATAFGNTFGVMDQLITDITNGNTASISLDLGQLDTEMDNQLRARADVGARVNRVDLITNRMDDQNVNMTDLLSKTEDVDLAQVITQYQVQQNVYRSSLATSAKIVQPSLIDFLR